MIRAEMISDLFARRLSHALHAYAHQPYPTIDRAALLAECIADYEAVADAVTAYEQSLRDRMAEGIKTANAAVKE